MTGDDSSELERLKIKLAADFKIKDLGTLKYFLRMEFIRSKEGIFVKYVLDLLGEIGLLGCKAAAKPESVVNKEQYQRLVGRLIYLLHTHPNIDFAVSMVSQFMHSPGPKHFDVVVGV